MPTGLFVGLATLDIIQVVDALPAPNGKTTARQSWLAAGGPATVAAIAFAALGGSARLVTALGTGAAADLVRADLATAGVELLDAAPDWSGLAPSVALVDAASGERAVVSGSAGAPERLDLPDHGSRGRFSGSGGRFSGSGGRFSGSGGRFSGSGGRFCGSRGRFSGSGGRFSALPDGLEPADVVLVDGHHPALALHAARLGAAAGVPVVVDAGSYKPVFEELWPLATDVICSADFADPEGLPPAGLLGRGPSLVAVSHGADPLQWWTADGGGTVPVPSVEAVDTLGAGDVLHGGYAFALAGGHSRTAALRFAVTAASRRVTSRGPFAWRTDLRRLRSPGAIA